MGLDTDLRGLPARVPCSRKAKTAGYYHNTKHHDEITQDVLNLAERIKLSPAGVDALITERRRIKRHRRRKWVHDKRGLWELVEPKDPNVHGEDDDDEDYDLDKEEFQRRIAYDKAHPRPRRNKFGLNDHMGENWNDELIQARWRAEMEKFDEDKEMDEQEMEDEEVEDEGAKEAGEDEKMKDEDIKEDFIKDEPVEESGPKATSSNKPST